MKIGIAYPERMQGNGDSAFLGHTVHDQFSSMVAGLQTWSSAQHDDDGNHTDITADSIVLTGDITGGGNLSVSGGTDVLGEFEFLSGDAYAFEMIRIGGTTDGWMFGRRPSPSIISGEAFALYDLASDATNPVFEVGYYTIDGVYLLVPRAAGGHDFGIGYKSGASTDRIRHIAVEEGLFERGRLTAAGNWAVFTPTLASGGTLGNGVLNGRVTLIGTTPFVEIAFVVGTTTVFDGTPIVFTLPYAKRSDGWANLGTGQWYALDVSAGAQYLGTSFGNGSLTQITPIITGANQAITAVLNNATPFVWAPGDELLVSTHYEMA